MSAPRAAPTSTATDLTDPVVSPGVLLGWPGAAPGDPPDEQVAAHYGDPLAEQRRGSGVVDRSQREVIAVSGPDRFGWLHSLTTQHLEQLPAGEGREALVLSPHGHVEHHLVLHDDGETTWLDVEAGTADALLEFLNRMRFLLRVEARRIPYAVLTLVGDAQQAAGDLPPDVPQRPMPWGTDLLVPAAQASEVAADLAGRVGPLGHTAFEAARVLARRPRLGFETDHRTIPNELPWLATAVHLDKGCYRGQETVARTYNLGRPPRRLVLLQLDGALPARHAPLRLDGRQVGFVGTAVYTEADGPVALALVKRNVPDDAALIADGTDAAGHEGIAAAIEPND